MNWDFLLLSALSYIAAWVIVGLLGWIAEFLLMLFIPLLRRFKLLGPVFRFIGEGIASFGSVYLVAEMGRLTPLRASVAMVLVPAVLHYFNDRKRIAKVKRGESGVLDILAERGEGHLYDQRHDLWTEYGSCWGHLIGFVNGIFIFLGGAEFF